MKILKRVALVLPILFLLVFSSVSYALKSNSVVATVTILGVKPVIVITSPTNNTYNKLKVPLNFTINEPVSWIGYSLDSTKNKTIKGNTTLNDLKDGAHNIIVYANNTAGMSASNKVYFYYCLADVNGDKKIDMTDIKSILNHLGQKCGSKKYDSTYDLNDDCVINIFDALIALVNYGKKCK
jgi:hypothetical protein